MSINKDPKVKKTSPRAKVFMVPLTSVNTNMIKSLRKHRMLHDKSTKLKKSQHFPLLWDMARPLALNLLFLLAIPFNQWKAVNQTHHFSCLNILSIIRKHTKRGTEMIQVCIFIYGNKPFRHRKACHPKFETVCTRSVWPHEENIGPREHLIERNTNLLKLRQINLSKNQSKFIVRKVLHSFFLLYQIIF
jgi:hypothetical protein